MEKVVAEEIKTCKRKEKENKRAKQVVELGSIEKRTIQKIVEKHVRAQFTITWIPLIIVEMHDHFHHDF
jgi:hypothetical protein